MSKTLGIIGGIGPESTIEYYRRILAGYRERAGTGHAPRILINSIDNKKVLDLVAAGQTNDLVEYLSAELELLGRAGAEVALLAANTPHLVFDQLAARTSVSLLSIVDVTCRAAAASKLRRLALLGTRFTMDGTFYPERFARAGIELVVPNEQEQEYIHTKYIGELLRGVIRPETREELLRIVTAMKERDAIDGLILGGTELSLILREPRAAGLPVLDTTQIHVEAAIDAILA